MVSAQAAEACGDNEEAIAQYKAMLDSERTVATGQRGLAQQLLARGDLSGAIDHASRAYAENKNCLLYTSPSPRDLSTSRMPSSA